MQTKVHDSSDSSSNEVNSLNEAAQILHLKRLLVTLKQQSEKEIKKLQNQLFSQEKINQSLKDQLLQSSAKFKKLQSNHDEELDALRDQFISLRNLLQQTQEELRFQNDQAVHASNKMQIIHSNQREEEASGKETERLREELSESNLRTQEMQALASKNYQKYEQEIQHLKHLLSQREIAEHQTEVIASHTASYQLRLELEEIKQTLKQGNYDTKALETQYVEVLNEKVKLEHQIKQLQTELEHQSSNLAAFQIQIPDLNQSKKELEECLKEKENLLNHTLEKQDQLKERLFQMELSSQEKMQIQEKYELLKEEWNQLNESLEEALDIRVKSEQEVIRFSELLKEKNQILSEKEGQIFQLLRDKENQETHLHEMNHLVNESETRFKIAQQHLAKKLKEAAILSEKVEGQQRVLEEISQNNENFKIQINQLQASLEISQKQEKKFQEQLHDALKSTESQVSKWEEKYFCMYDKWQESENCVKKLKKIEEKHQQMQNLIANLGNFMGGPSSQNFLHTMQELVDKSNQQKNSEEEQPESVQHPSQEDEEKYDLFGMKFRQDKPKPDSLS
ncbi:hypothetical protein [Candidatus Protochlamydia sp. R18]|uniref:hypothetical protein n=1 Tax=Candidatus Protochlamydia sp. R18 TaxID=1353977 RepID=UPI0005A956AA|nr:hypothetical protein [Candidatus Protochlamydia sp. R18]